LITLREPVCSISRHRVAGIEQQAWSSPDRSFTM
jgi:hypothetical protein